MVADELLQRIDTINNLENQNSQFNEKIKELNKIIENNNEKINSLLKEKDNLALKESKLEEREKQIKDREILQLKLDESEKREKARMECFELVFKNRQWRESISKQHITGYKNDGGLDAYESNVSKDVVEE